MRAKKEIFFLSLVGLLGAACGGWCTAIFGSRATGEVLIYSGAIASGFYFVAKMINEAFSAISELDAFDRLTRERFELCIRTMRRRFVTRMLLGVGMAFLTIGIGVFIKEAVPTPSMESAIALAAAGGAAFFVSGTMLGAQLWAASWAADYIAESKRVAREQAFNRERLRSYSLDKLPT